MNLTVTGLAVGLVLGLTAAWGGFGAMAIVALLGALGALVGRFLSGQLDLSAFGGGARDRGPR
jgi:hypothetical protein